MGKNGKKLLAILLALMMVFTVCSPTGGGSGVGTTNAEGNTAATPTNASKDLSNYITGITIGTKDAGGQNYSTISGGTTTSYVGDGDDIQITINYSVSDGELSNDNNVVTYQLPNTISITEAQNGYVYTDGNKVGTYTIDTNGLVTITFDTDSEYLTLTQAFTGYITFECEANLTGTGSSSEISFAGYSTALNVAVVAGKNDCDIDTTKTASSKVKNTDGSYTITYTVIVSTTKGTRGTVDVTDALSGMTGVTFDSASVSVTKGDTNESVTDYTTSVSDTSLSITGLSQLSAGEYYTITYSVTVSSDTYTALNGTSYLSNTAKATSTDEGNLYTDSDNGYNYTAVTHSMAAKSSSTSSDGNTITWTIVINAAGDNLNGYTLSDVLGSSLNENNISNFIVTKTSGDSTDNSSNITKDVFFGSGYTFSSNDYNTYTITYSYTSTDLVRESDITIDNDVYLKNGLKDYTAEGNGVLYATSHIGKSYVNATGEGTDNATYSWTITLKGSATDSIPSGSYITDTLGSYMTITKTNASSFSASENISATVTFYNGSGQSVGTLTFNDGTTGTLSWNDENKVATYFVITLNSAVTSNVTISYSATPTYDGMSLNETRYFENKARLTIGTETEKEVTATHGYTLKEVLEKYIYAATTTSYTYNDWTQSPDDTTYGTSVYPTTKDTSSGSYDFTAYAEDGVYFYYILVNADGSLNNATDNVVINDKISGGTYVSGSAKLLNDVNWGYTINTSYSITTETTSDGIKITIPAGAFSTSGTNAVQYYIVYAVKVDEETETVALSNTASISGSAETTVTVNVEPDTGSEDVLSKTAVQGSNGNGVTADVTYTINVNLGSEDLLDGYDTLTLYDEMEVPASGLLNVTLSDIKVYTADSSGNKISELTGGWSYTFDKDTSGSSKWYYYLTLTVPDETALIVEYIYTYTYDSQQTGGRTIVNSVTIQGTEYSVSEEEGYTIASSSAGTNNGSTVTVYKVDSSDYSIYLSGAVFKFEYYDTNGGGWTSVSGNSTVTINESVKFTTNTNAAASSDTIIVNANTLYRLTETAAPTGYSTGSTVFYMVFANSGTSVSDLKTSMSSLLNTLGIDADSVSYYADGVSGYQEQIPNTATGTLYITKNWVNENGSAITPTETSVDVTLYETAMSKDSSTVIVETYQPYGNTAYTTASYDVKNGTTMTITFTYDYSISTSTTLYNGNTEVTGSLVKTSDTGRVAVYTYEFTVNGDTTIKLNESSAWDRINISASYTAGYYSTGSTSSSAVKVTETANGSGVYDLDVSNGDTTITLSSENDWTAMVTGLDINALYSVIENTTLSGYTVTYSSDVALTEATDLSSATYSGSIVVTNTSNGVSGTSVSLSGTKTLSGGTLSDEQFKFILSDGTDALQTVYNDANGAVSFEGISYTESDAGNTYTYYIYEDTTYNTDSNTDLYTYDETCYKVIVTVSLNNNKDAVETTIAVRKYDSLTAATSDTGNTGGTEVQSATSGTGYSYLSFANTYYGDGSIEVTKTFASGSTVSDVIFALYKESQGAETLVETQTLTATDYNRGNYTVTFTGLDTRYTYKVYEVTTDTTPFVTYGDGSTITIGSHTYNVSTSNNSVTINNSSKTATVSFTNTEVASLAVEKTISGSASSASDEFTFTVYLGGGTLLGTASGAYGYETYAVGSSGTVLTSGSLTLAANTGQNSTDYPYYTTITLKGGDGYRITGLPSGTTYYVVENDYSSSGYTSQCTTGNDTNTSGISAGGAVTVGFTNTKTSGSLKIGKTVSGTGSLSSFDFTVTLTGDISTSQAYTAVKTSGTQPTTTGSWVSSGTNSYYDSSDNSHTYTVDNGVYTETTSITFAAGTGSTYTATVTLKDGETFEITGLPAGTTYTVAETDYTSTGYLTTIESGSETGTITDGATSSVSFLNTVVEKGSLSISKVLSGNDVDDYTNTTFNVNVYLGTGTSGKQESDLQTSYNVTIKSTTAPAATGTWESNGTNSYYDSSDGSHTYTYDSTTGVYTETAKLTFTSSSYTDGNNSYCAVAAVSLKSGETITIKGLYTGTIYTIVESDASSSDFDVSYIYTTTGNSGTISSSSAYTVTIVNTRNTYGDLTISKTVTGNAASANTGRKYTFEINLNDTGISENYNYYYATTASPGTQTGTGTVEFKSGIAIVTLTEGQTITIQNLPNGTNYTVTEVDAMGYGDYTITATDAGGQSVTGTAASGASVTGTIEGGTNSVQTVAFTNNIDKEGTLTINKVISGNDTDSSKSFEFTITLSNADSSYLNKTYTATSTGGSTSITSVTFSSGTATVHLTGGQSVTITGLPNSATYTVTESSYTNDGYTTTVGSSTATSTSNTERTASGTISNSTPQAVTYTNTKDTYGDLLIGKTVEENGTTVATNNSDRFVFTVTLTGTNNSDILNGTYPATSTGGAGLSSVKFTNGSVTIMLKSGQTVNISNIPNGVGYTVTETAVSGYVTTYSTDGTSYSTTGNSVSGAIDGGNGTSGENTQYYAMFKNTVISQSLSVSKVLSGNDVSTDDYFAFEITIRNSSGALISGTYNGVTFTSGAATIYVNGGSTKTIAGLPVGTQYTVTEKSGVYSLDGSDYVLNSSAAEYTLEDINETTVTGGVTSSSGTITENTGCVEVFTNTRNSYGTLTVSKSVSTGDKAKKFEFTIKLTNTTDSSVLNGSYSMASNVGDYDGVYLTFSSGVATVSLADGEYVTLSGLPNGVNYTVTEADYSSDGYITTSVGGTASVVGGEDYTAAFTNKLTSISISKVDVTDGEELPGATIQIIDSNGNVVKEWISTDEPYEITGLIPGETYTLRETVAPAGYDVSTDTTFVIDEYGNVTTTATVTAGGIILVEDALLNTSTTEITTETTETTTETTTGTITETTTETTTETSETSNTVNGPDTGDDTPVAPVMVLFGVSVAGIFMTLLVKSKEKKRNRR